MEEKPEINEKHVLRVPVRIELETLKEDALEKALEGQADWVRAIVQEELAKYEKRKIQELRFGKPYPDKEVK